MLRHAAAFLLLALALPLAAHALGEPVERIKAAFLYRFASYVEWPATAFASVESPIVIGVADAEPVALELSRVLPGRKAGLRPLRVVRLARGDRVADCCHILFVGSAGASMDEVLAQAQGRPVLTVTDVDSGHPRGSVINFQLVEDRIRFDISREAADRNHLALRAQLLAVARHVSTP